MKKIFLRFIDRGKCFCKYNQKKYNKNTTFIKKHKKIQLYITEYNSVKNGSNDLF